MISDHRRILATALGRVRGKLLYRPVVFELMAEAFTLSALQRAVEAIAGVSLHKQNFRRALERAELVEGLGQHGRRNRRPARRTVPLPPRDLGARPVSGPLACRCCGTDPHRTQPGRDWIAARAPASIALDRGQAGPCLRGRLIKLRDT